MKKYKLKLDYTADELKELKILGVAYDSPIAAVYRLGEKESINDLFRNLQRKYRILDIHKEFDFMTDINNAVMGTAIFPEEKYVVHDKVAGQYIYYNVTEWGLRRGEIGRVIPDIGGEIGRVIPDIQTKDEWLAINPAYEAMLEEVEK